MENFLDLPTRSTLPFPVLTNVVPSAKTVQLLKKLCYSKGSELTAITTYLYQDWQLYPKYQDIANELEQISIAEMTHLDVLSNAIVAFGGTPNYSFEETFWTGKNVSSSTRLPDIMYENIMAENKAIEDYEEAIKNVDNESLKKIFEKIIEDEKTHISIFQAIIKFLQTSNDS